MPRETPAKPAAEARGAPSELVRSVVSLMLFMHLFCVFVALTANYAASDLQSRILSVLRFYTQTLNFDLNQTPYQLTHAEPIDVDHRIEVLPAEMDENDPLAWFELSAEGFRGGERQKRYQRLGELMDMSVELGRDDRVALLASSVGAYYLNQRGVKPKQIRCRRHSLVPLEAFTEPGSSFPRDPFAPSYFSVVYAANAVVDEEERTVEVVKIDAAGQVARPTESP